MAESINEVGDKLSTQARSTGLTITRLECEQCGLDAWPGDPAQVAKLVEHCTYEHLGHAGILGVQHHKIADGYDLAMLLGASAANEHEENWRARHDNEPCSHFSRTITHVASCQICGVLVSAS